MVFIIFPGLLHRAVHMVSGVTVWHFLPMAASMLCGCSPAVVSRCWQLVLFCEICEMCDTCHGASSLCVSWLLWTWVINSCAGLSLSKSWGKSKCQYSWDIPGRYIGEFRWHCWYIITVISEACYLSWLWTYFVAGNELQHTDHQGYDELKYAICQ